MNRFGGKWVTVLVVIAALVLSPVAAPPIHAGDTGMEMAAPVLGVLCATAIGYVLWVNRPSQQGKPWPIPGEFYVGGFIGASIPVGGSLDFNTAPGIKVSDIDIQKGVVGGLKFGYFCPWFPYAGLEAETNFTRNDIRSQGVTLSPSISGGTTGIFQAQKLNIWSMALKLMLRYGFIPDPDVSTFGRLQPYVGVGPGFVVVFSKTEDTEKPSLEVSAGLRYMLLKNVSTFVEYQFSRVFQTDFQSEILACGKLRSGSIESNWDSHKVVAGVSYHF
jgi:opacity protein-like surface antigen